MTDETKFLGRVISGHRVTIPDPIREYYHVKEGDLLEIAVLGKKTPE